MYDTWHEGYTAVRAQVPDMAVGIMEPGEAPLPLFGLLLSASAKAWLETPGTQLFYAFHWYGKAGTGAPIVKVVEAIAGHWKMPALMTEMEDCDVSRVGFKPQPFLREPFESC